MLDWLYILSLFLHLVATVVWIGGLLLLSLLVWPEARRFLTQHGNAPLVEYLDRVRTRFNPYATLSLLVLIVTGVYQMVRDPQYEGMLQFNNDWSRAILVKHIAVLGMIVAGALMQWQIIPALERAALYTRQGKPIPATLNMDALRRRERQLLLVNSVLGVLVLVFTAIATSI